MHFRACATDNLVSQQIFQNKITFTTTKGKKETITSLNVTQVEDSKGGATGQGKAGTSSVRKSFGSHGMRGKRRRTVVDDGQERCTGGRSLCDRAREEGEEAGTKRYRSGVDG